MIIDIHTHAFPDGLASRAIAGLEEAADWQAVGDGTVDGLLGSMDAGGIDISCICAIATRPGQAQGILDWCTSIRSDRIVPFPSVHPDTPDAAAWIARFAEEGFRGIKLHPMYQHFAADESRIDPLYAAAAEAGLLVTLHSGYDIGFPDDDRAAAPRIASVIERHPTLKLLSTHLGGWKAWDATRERLLGKGLYFETSFSLAMLGPARATELIRQCGIDRVLFGTDWPWKDQAADVQLVQDLDLTQDQRTTILGGNAAKLLGIRG